ncbi:MAG TPA: putative glycolipid-binding domain-containing protein [Pseudonocardiaceae bacterium]
MPEPTHRATMLTWQGHDAPHLESVRVLQNGDRRLRASGRVVSTLGDQGAYTASYDLLVDETGTVRRLLLRTTTADAERQILLSHAVEGEDSFWLVDLGHGEGEQRTDFGGAVDVDVQYCALFNSLPVRRLGLHRQPGDHELPVVFVSLPDLSVRQVQQHYRTVSIGETGSVITYQAGDFRADVTFDTDAFVLDYPSLSRRI